MSEGAYGGAREGSERGDGCARGRLRGDVLRTTSYGYGQQGDSQQVFGQQGYGNRATETGLRKQGYGNRATETGLRKQGYGAPSLATANAEMGH